MTRIGITGGIGSGKTYVCQLLQQRGIPVYQCDDEAKRLMTESPVIRKQLRKLIGAEAYTPSGLNKPATSSPISATPNASTASSIPLSVRTSSNGPCNKTHPSLSKSAHSFSSRASKTPSILPSKSMPHSTFVSNVPSSATMPPLSKYKPAWHSRWTKKKNVNAPTSASSTMAPPTSMRRLTNYSHKSKNLQIKK